MSKILGLDLGTNSVGWALYNDETGTFLKSGVRIFEEDVLNINQGQKEITKNAQRRMARGARRNNFRYKLRRRRLKRALKEFDMMPGAEYYTNVKGDKKNLTKMLYELRVRALEEKITLQELGRIFLHINQRRGFQSNKKEEAHEETKALEKTNEKNSKGKKSDDKKLTTADVKESIANLEDTIRNLSDEKKLKHGTLGEYFYYLINLNEGTHKKNEPAERIRDRYTSRQMYINEFDKIWEFQKQFYPDELDDKRKKVIRDECLFFQRDLRSTKHLVGRCPYEYSKYFDEKTNEYKRSYKKCCPASTFEFQEYRIWDQLNNIRIKEDGTSRKLTEEQKKEIAALLMNKNTMKLSAVKKTLGLNRYAKFNDVPDTLKGNATNAKLRNALGSEYWDSLFPEQPDDPFAPVTYSKTQIDLYNNILFAHEFINGTEWLKNAGKKKDHLFKKLGLTEEQIENLSKITLDQGHARFSLKAARKIIPFTKSGLSLIEAEKEIGYLRTQSENSEVEKNKKIDVEQLLKMGYNKKVPQLENHELRNPIVQRTVAEAVKVINAIIDHPRLGRPDIIRIEMARELKKPKDVRSKMKKRIDDADKKRKKLAEFLSQRFNREITTRNSIIKKFELFLELNYSDEAFNKIKDKISEKEFRAFAHKYSSSDMKKYDLWLECDRVLPYSGKTVSLSELFSPEIEIEHIIPYSKSMDNSFMNKTLSLRNVNREKAERTPLEYFDSRDKKERDEFLQRIKSLPEEKQKRFRMRSEEIDEFRNSQLNNTAYAARQLRKHLEHSFLPKQIKITNGQLTAFIRSIFGLNDILVPAVKATGEQDGRCYAVYEDGEVKRGFIQKDDLDDAKKDMPGAEFVPGEISNEKFYPDLKTRDDHRHHSIDAAVTAVVSPAVFQLVTQYSKRDKFNGYAEWNHEARTDIRNELAKKIQSVDFRKEVQESVKQILISTENRSKLISSSKKRVYKNGQPAFDDNGNPRYSGGDVARGSLHDESVYRIIKYPYINDENGIIKPKPIRLIKKENLHNRNVTEHQGSIVTKNVAISQLNEKNIPQIIDPVVRNTIIKSIEEHKGKFNDARKEGFFLKGKKGTKTPIKKVKIAADIVTLAEIKPNTFVVSEDIFLFAIYGSELPERKYSKEKLRAYETVTFLQAVERMKRQRPIFNKEKDGFPLLSVLTHHDLLVLFENSPDEIDWNDYKDLSRRLFQTSFFDKEGSIYIKRHFLTKSFGNLNKNNALEDYKKDNIWRTRFLQYGERQKRSSNLLGFIRVRTNVLGEIEPEPISTAMKRLGKYHD